MEQRVAAGVQLVDRGRRPRIGKRLAPYLLTLPGGLWLAIFFLVPIVFMLSISLQTGNLERCPGGASQPEEETSMPEPSFRDYFSAANAQTGLTEREKIFIGLAVTLSRGCEP